MFAFLVADVLQRCKLTCRFSPGDFVRASKEASKKPRPNETMVVEETKDACVFFSFPNEVASRYTRDTPVSKGICRLANARSVIPEKETLLDRAKLRYHAILQGPVARSVVSVNQRLIP